MIVVGNIDTQSTKFFDQLFNLTLSWVAPHVANLFVALSAQNFEYGTRKTISDGHLRLVG